MSGTIDLPTLVQKVRVDTRSMNRAEKAAAKFGRTADHSFSDAADSANDYTDSTVGADKGTRSLNESMADLRATIVETRRETVGFDDDLDSTRRTTSGMGDDSDSGRKGLLGLASGFKVAGGGAKGLGSLIGSIKWSVIATGISLAAGAVTALTAASIGFIAQVAPVVGVLGALPATLTALLSTKAVFTSLIKGPKEAAKAIRKYGADSEQAKEALKKLSPEGRKFTLQLVKTQKQFDRIRKVGEAAAFPNLSKALERFRTLLPLIERGFKGIATVIGDTGLELANAVSTGPFKKDLGVIVERNTTLIKTLASALVPLVTFIKNVTLAAGPMTQGFADAFVKGSQFLASVTGGTKGQKRLTDFFAKTTSVVESLGRTFRDLGVGVFNLFSIGGKNSTDFLGNMENLAKKFRDFTESVSGKSKIAKFFQDAKPVIHETGLLIKDIFFAIGTLGSSQDLAPLISQIRTDLLPRFLDFAELIGKNIGPTLVTLAEAFLAFQGVLTFSPIVAVADAVAKMVIAFSDFVTLVPGMGTLVTTLLAFSLATKAISIGGKVTGISALATALSNIGPAGTAGQKGIAGFIQGLKGATGGDGQKLTAANLFGKAIKGAGALGKKAGRGFTSGLTGALEKAKSVGSTLKTRLGEDLVDLKEVGKKGGTKLLEGLKTQLPKLKAFGSSVAGKIGSGLSSLKGAALSGLSALGPMLRTVATGFKVAAGAAKAFTIALLTNPVFLIIAAVIALVAALIYAYKHSETFRNIVNGAFTAIKNVALAVFNFLKAFITTTIKVIGTVIRTYVNIYRTIFVTAFNAIKAIVSTVVKVIATIIRTYVAVYRKVFSVAWNAIKTVVKGAIDFVKNTIRTGLAVAKAIIKTVVDTIKGIFRTGMDIIKGIVRTVFTRIPEIIKEKVAGVLTYLGTFGAKILDKLGDFGSLLYEAGKSLIRGLVNGIKAVASLPVDAVKGILGGIADLLPGSPVKKGPLRKLNHGYAGKQVATMFADGIKRNAHKVDNALGGLSLDPGALAATVGSTPLAKATAAGGGAAGATTITYDQRKTYDVDVHETTGPTSVDSLTRRLAAITLLGPQAAAAGGTVVRG